MTDLLSGILGDVHKLHQHNKKNVTVLFSVATERPNYTPLAFTILRLYQILNLAKQHQPETFLAAN